MTAVGRRRPGRDGAARRLVMLVLLLVAPRTLAQAAAPAPHEQVAFDFMNLLSEHGLHDLSNETWNAYGQTTYISSWKLPFPAPYTNLNGSTNSLLAAVSAAGDWRGKESTSVGASMPR